MINLKNAIYLYLHDTMKATFALKVTTITTQPHAFISFLVSTYPPLSPLTIKITLANKPIPLLPYTTEHRLKKQHQKNKSYIKALFAQIDCHMPYM